MFRRRATQIWLKASISRVGAAVEMLMQILAVIFDIVAAVVALLFALVIVQAVYYPLIHGPH